jgi:MFS family permease
MNAGAGNAGGTAVADAMREQRMAWLAFGLAAAAFWLSFFHRVSPAAIAVDLQAAFGIGGAMLGTLAATYYLIYTVMQVPTGILNDTLGPRRVLFGGCLIAGAGSLIFAAADTVWIAILGRTLAGLGVSVAFISMLKFAADAFPERRFATMTGIGAMVGLTGGLAAATPLAWAVGYVSWRAIFAAAGVLSLVLAATIWMVVRDRARVEASPRSAGGEGTRWREGLALVARNPHTWPCFWFGFGMSGSYMTFVGLWAVPYLVHAHGMSVVAATQHTSLIIVCLAASQGVIGALSDRIGRRRPLVLASALAYLASWAGWLSGAAALPGMSYAISVLMGLSVCGMTLSWVCAKEVNPPQYSGIAISLVNTSGFLAVGLLQPLVGWLIDRSAAGDVQTGAHYMPGVAVLAVFAGIALVAALFMRETGCRNIWSELHPQEGK